MTTSRSSQDWIRARTDVLERSTSSEALEVAATELASSDLPDALAELGRFLSAAEFLSRLDDVAEPGSAMIHLGGVMKPLVDRPSPEVVELCLALAETPAFVAGADRKSLLLEAMARAVPMTDATVDAFRRANGEGYFNFDAPLLAENSSPAALALLFEMLTDAESDASERVWCIHSSIVHRRNRVPIVELVARLMSEASELEIALAAIESLFDYQPRWFNLHTPPPPSWRIADAVVLHRVIDLGTLAKRHPSLSDELQDAIDLTLDTARALLARRAR